jgi:hypothetical protein
MYAEMLSNIQCGKTCSPVEMHAKMLLKSFSCTQKEEEVSRNEFANEPAKERDRTLLCFLRVTTLLEISVPGAALGEEAQIRMPCFSPPFASSLIV